VIEEISQEQLEDTFKTNIFAQFYLAKHGLKYIPAGGSIINTTSVVAYAGSAHLLDYGATKGAIVAFTRCLALQLAEKEIRVSIQAKYLP
jgi:NAD(P)-dependent dehydrogenase (short-subunit alcohol dehydrogenase family)